jgi:hypothetical protein
MVGLTNARSIQDEKLVEATFISHVAPESRVSQSVYGATATNLIIDARPTTNAVANTAKGAGTENMDYYKDCKKAYLGIDNIHSMRDYLNKVVEVLSEPSSTIIMIITTMCHPLLVLSSTSSLRVAGALRRHRDNGWGRWP